MNAGHAAGDLLNAVTCLGGGPGPGGQGTGEIFEEGKDEKFPVLMATARNFTD